MSSLKSLQSLLQSIKQHLYRVKMMDVYFSNVIVNAFAVMLVYSSHFGSCAISPIIINSMDGIGGINSHLIFTGISLSSITTILCCPFISPAIDKLGTWSCLIVGSVCTLSLAPSLWYPIPPVYLTFQAINGVGCALLRAASLKYLTDNSPHLKLAEYNGIHWSIFMSGVLVGNVVLLIATGSNDTISDELRSRICVSLTTLGLVGLLLYCVGLRRPGPDDSRLLREFPVSGRASDKDRLLNEERDNRYQSRALLPPLPSSPVLQDNLTASCEYLDHDTSETSGVADYFSFLGSLKHLKKWSTLNLVIAMFSCAIFPALYATLCPMFIGQLLSDKKYVALFGMSAGLGCITGSLLAGRIISRIGPKILAGIVTTTIVLALAISTLSFPLTTSGSTLIRPSPALLLLLGFICGAGDSAMGVLISTLVGRVYKDFSQAGFAVYSLIFNLSAVGLYFIASYSSFEVVECVMTVIAVAALAAVLLLKNKHIT